MFPAPYAPVKSVTIAAAPRTRSPGFTLSLSPSSLLHLFGSPCSGCPSARLLLTFQLQARGVRVTRRGILKCGSAEAELSSAEFMYRLLDIHGEYFNIEDA